MDYEDYMRSILGYSPMPNNIYTNSYDNYYYDMDYLDNRNSNATTEVIESMYPDIYRIVYPMVSRICAQNSQREITRELVDSMTEEIYLNVEPEERQSTISTARQILKNGDERTPNAKETEVRNETRQRNFLLRDLIRILILRELLRRRQRPPMPPMRPPRPPMPPMIPY